MTIGSLPPISPDGIHLKKGDEAGDQHGVLQQINAQGTESAGIGNAACGHDDQKRRQIADKHRQNMLKSKRNRLPKRNPPIQRIR